MIIFKTLMRKIKQTNTKFVYLLSFNGLTPVDLRREANGRDIALSE